VSAGLSAARSLLSNGTRSWPRGCAFLVRMELEEWVRSHSVTLDKNLANASMRSQLLCLGQTVQEDQAVRATYSWHRLSEACHQHAYELAPTVGELRFLLDEVESLIECGSKVSDSIIVSTVALSDLG
jgi:hypothetical protein